MPDVHGPEPTLGLHLEPRASVGSKHSIDERRREVRGQARAPLGPVLDRERVRIGRFLAPQSLAVLDDRAAAPGKAGPAGPRDRTRSCNRAGGFDASWSRAGTVQARTVPTHDWSIRPG